MAAHEKKKKKKTPVAKQEKLFGPKLKIFSPNGLKRRGHDKQSFVSVYTVLFFFAGRGG